MRPGYAYSCWKPNVAVSKVRGLATARHLDRAVAGAVAATPCDRCRKGLRLVYSNSLVPGVARLRDRAPSEQESR